MPREFVIVSGGPGLYVPCDKDHDMSWSNYVDNILLLKKNNKLTLLSDERVQWFVYGPAFERRWTDDESKNTESVKLIKKKATNYKNHLDNKAKEYGWNLKWLTSANDFWTNLQIFGNQKISRVWYFGHAKDDLWLSLRHNGCTAIAPLPEEIIRVSQIETQSSLASKFQPSGTSYDENRSFKFYGCNSAAFAEKWAKVFNVYTEGAEGKIDFKNAHRDGGELRMLLTGCTWKKFAPGGSAIP